MLQTHGMPHSAIYSFAYYTFIHCWRDSHRSDEVVKCSFILIRALSW